MASSSGDLTQDIAGRIMGGRRGSSQRICVTLQRAVLLDRTPNQKKGPASLRAGQRGLCGGERGQGKVYSQGQK